MTELNIINRLENLENQNVHLHQHLETIIVLLHRQELKLLSLSDEDNCPDVDIIDELEQYTPINEIDRLKKETRIRIMRENLEEINKERFE